MVNDLISVIVPVYNCEKYVRRTLDSIVSQTYDNLEILVIDDGSTDGSPAICDNFSTDNRVKVFHRQNVGVAASRQFGIEQCHGTYFVTLDSDDYVSANYVEKLYNAIKENDADISVCGVSCFNDGEDDLRLVYMPPNVGGRLVVTTESLACGFYKLSQDMLLTDSWNKMHRTQFVRDTNVKYELPQKYTGPELQFEHRLVMHCPVYSVCQESLLFHRMRQGSRVQRKDKPLQEGFEIITESLIRESKTVGIEPKQPLSHIYYGLMGMVVLDIFYYGGGIRERHSRFQQFVLRNQRFLHDHSEVIKRYNAFNPIKLSALSVPSFMLNSAYCLDLVAWCYLVLRKMRYGSL